MKSLVFGCLGVTVGAILGAALVLVVNSNFSKSTSPTSEPLADTRSDLAVSISAPYAAFEIQQALRQSGVAKGATVSFAAPNLVRLTTTVQASALGVPLSIDANVSIRVSLQKGRIVLTMESVDAGGFSIPSSVIESGVEPIRAQAEDQINRLAQRALNGTGLRVSNIRISPQVLTVELSSQ